MWGGQRKRKLEDWVVPNYDEQRRPGPVTTRQATKEELEDIERRCRTKYRVEEPSLSKPRKTTWFEEWHVRNVKPSHSRERRGLLPQDTTETSRQRT